MLTACVVFHHSSALGVVASLETGLVGLSWLTNGKKALKLLAGEEVSGELVMTGGRLGTMGSGSLAGELRTAAANDVGCA